MNNFTNVIDVINTSKGNYILRLDKNGINFNAGQFFSIGHEKLGINREYSVASSSDKNYIDFFIREVEGGSFSGELRKLKKGDKVKILGPYGEFYLRSFNPDANFIFFATGTGIAPFVSLIDTHKIINYTIFHGIREFDDFYNLKKLNNYNLAISRESIDQNKSDKFQNIKKGRINQFVKNLTIEENMLFFLCGNSLMVSQIYDELINKKVKQEKIFTEIFF